MPEPTIAPALTPEEWKHPTHEFMRGTIEDRLFAFVPTANHAETGQRKGALRVAFGAAGFHNVPEDARHALAALALHGQPFGFTREDVRLCQEQIVRSGHDYGDNPRWRDLAARIDALLPPEGA